MSRGDRQMQPNTIEQSKGDGRETVLKGKELLFKCLVVLPLEH